MDRNDPRRDRRTWRSQAAEIQMAAEEEARFKQTYS